ncbi:unnamed protein product, partial [Amoebophrya sp. A120]
VQIQTNQAKKERKACHAAAVHARSGVSRRDPRRCRPRDGIPARAIKPGAATCKRVDGSCKRVDGNPNGTPSTPGSRGLVSSTPGPGPATDLVTRVEHARQGSTFRHRGGISWRRS